MGRFPDFELREVLTVIAETFNYSVEVIKKIWSSAVLYNRNSIFCAEASISGNCRVRQIYDIFEVDNGNGLFFAYAPHSLSLTSEQLELLEYLGYRFLPRENSFMLTCEGQWRRDTFDEVSPYFSILNAMNDTLDQTISTLRADISIDQSKLTQFLFEKEQTLVSTALRATNAEKNLVAIALHNVLDQGRLLLYRRDIFTVS